MVFVSRRFANNLEDGKRRICEQAIADCIAGAHLGKRAGIGIDGVNERKISSYKHWGGKSERIS